MDIPIRKFTLHTFSFLYTYLLFFYNTPTFIFIKMFIQNNYLWIYLSFLLISYS